MPARGQPAPASHPFRKKMETAAKIKKEKTSPSKDYVRSAGSIERGGFLCPNCGDPYCIGGTGCGGGSSF